QHRVDVDAVVRGRWVVVPEVLVVPEVRRDAGEFGRLGARPDLLGDALGQRRHVGLGRYPLRKTIRALGLIGWWHVRRIGLRYAERLGGLIDGCGARQVDGPGVGRIN